MGMHVALAFQHFDERIETQIAARRDQIFFASGGALVVDVPRGFVVAGFGERAADGFFDAHARGGITRRSAASTEVRVLGIFAESELDAGQGAFERELRGGLAPAEFDDYGLAADGVGAAVENVGDGDSAGEIAVDVDIVGI